MTFFTELARFHTGKSYSGYSGTARLDQSSTYQAIQQLTAGVWNISRTVPKEAEAQDVIFALQGIN